MNSESASTRKVPGAWPRVAGVRPQARTGFEQAQVDSGNRRRRRAVAAPPWPDWQFASAAQWARAQGGRAPRLRGGARPGATLWHSVGGESAGASAGFGRRTLALNSGGRQPEKGARTPGDQRQRLQRRTGAAQPGNFLLSREANVRRWSNFRLSSNRSRARGRTETAPRRSVIAWLEAHRMDTLLGSTTSRFSCCCGCGLGLGGGGCGGFGLLLLLESARLLLC